MIPVPQTLVRYIREGRCVLFVGSGLSAWGGLPTWSALLAEMLTDLRKDEPERPDLAELQTLLTEGGLLDVASYLKEKQGPRYREILSERLRVDVPEIPDPHQVIVDLPFAGILTTNYDKLLEHAYARLGRPLPKAPTHDDVDALAPLLFDGSFFVLKAHGDIDRPDSLVLTAQDYQEIIHSNPAFASVVSAILLTKAILFIGYSLNDPDFRLLLDRNLVTFKRQAPARFALMSGVGEVESDVLFRSAGIKVLQYEEGNHAQVLEFLVNLKDQVYAPDSVTEPSRSVGSQVPQPGSTPTPEPRVLDSITLSVRFEYGSYRAAINQQGDIVEGSRQLPHRFDILPPFREATTHPVRDPEALDDPHREVGLALARCLPPNVLKVLGDAPRGHIVRLELGREIEHLPWEWIYLDDGPLFQRHALVRVPTKISREARGYPSIVPPVRVLLIGDPKTDEPGLASLPGAQAEVREIGALYADDSDFSCTIFISEDATSAAIVEALGKGFDVVHFAGHAWFDSQESFLFLDQGRLRASEFRTLLAPNPPAVVVLNSHFTAFVPPGVYEQRPTESPRDVDAPPAVAPQAGFSEIAYLTGVGGFIGTFGSVSDMAARTVGVNLHRELVNGRPVVHALNRAMNALPDEGDRSSWLYTLTGYPELALHQ